MLTAVQKMFFGPVTRRENARLKDLTPREMLALAPLTVLVFVLGFFPNILLSRMDGAVTRTLNDFEARLQMNPGPDYHKGAPKLLSRRPEAPARTVVPATETKANAKAEAP